MGNNIIDNNIIVLVGASASGKDSLASYFKSQGYNFITSHTTRPMRENELEGNPYYFIDNETFEGFIKNDELLECREYNTILNGVPQKWYYGVHKNEVKPNEKYIVVLDLLGASEFKSLFGTRAKSYYLEVPESVRRERAMKRGSFCEIEWERRMEADKNDFHWLKLNEVGVERIVFKWSTIEELYEEITGGE